MATAPGKPAPLSSSQRQRLYRKRQVQRVRVMTAALTKIRDRADSREIRDIAIAALTGSSE